MYVYILKASSMHSYQLWKVLKKQEVCKTGKLWKTYEFFSKNVLALKVFVFSFSNHSFFNYYIFFYNLKSFALFFNILECIDFLLKVFISSFQNSSVIFLKQKSIVFWFWLQTFFLWPWHQGFCCIWRWAIWTCESKWLSPDRIRPSSPLKGNQE